jgi:hypothetical protein
LGFASLMIFSVWNCQQFFSKLDFSLQIFQFVAYRPPYTSILLAILRQEIDSGEILSFGNNTDLYDTYRTKFALNEANLMYNVHILKKFYPNLFDYWNKLDSSEGCVMLYQNSTTRTPQCKFIMSVQQ